MQVPPSKIAWKQVGNTFDNPIQHLEREIHTLTEHQRRVDMDSRLFGYDQSELLTQLENNIRKLVLQRDKHIMARNMNAPPKSYPPQPAELKYSSRQPYEVYQKPEYMNTSSSYEYNDQQRRVSQGNKIPVAERRQGAWLLLERSENDAAVQPKAHPVTREVWDWHGRMVVVEKSVRTREREDPPKTKEETPKDFDIFSQDSLSLEEEEKDIDSSPKTT